MSDVLKPTRKTPPPEVAEMSPPTSPKLEGRKSKAVKEEQPIDLNIPDNYVAYTLRNSKPRPPVTWSNLLQELNYISLLVLTVTPTIAIVGALNVQLKTSNAIFAVLYYFFTGLGITAGVCTYYI